MPVPFATQRIWAFCRGGGGIMAILTQSRSFFGRFWIFVMVLGICHMGSCAPPYFGHGESKNQGPTSKRDSGWARRSLQVMQFC